MITICEHIEYLLRNHDCVIVPGWGAFIAQYQPASFTEDGQMLPPSRLIGFNASISHQDGLLASSVMRREKISYDAASNKNIITNKILKKKKSGGYDFLSLAVYQGDYEINKSYFDKIVKSFK